MHIGQNVAKRPFTDTLRGGARCWRCVERVGLYARLRAFIFARVGFCGLWGGVYTVCVFRAILGRS